MNVDNRPLKNLNRQHRLAMALPLLCCLISAAYIALSLGRLFVEESRHSPYIAYSVAEGALTEAVGPGLWHVKSEKIRIAPYHAADFRTYPEPLAPYFIQSTVFVPGKGILPWSCKIYYDMDDSKVYDTWRIAWIKVNGGMVLDNGDPCCGEPCPIW